jgi:lipoprotein-anchoring transpeptidase ErfK/SrfK
MQLRIVAASITAALALSTLPLVGAGTASAAEPPPIPKDVPLTYMDRGDSVRLAQKRLVWLGYEIRKQEIERESFGRETRLAVKKFQRKFFLAMTKRINKGTWNKLQEVGNRVGKLPKACLSEQKVICIDKTSKVLRFVRDGKVVQTLDVRFGVPGLETPAGTYRVYYKDRYATSGINGPNAPRVPMPYALFFNGDIAVHYSSTFAASGYYPGGGSHGCVNVADLDGVAKLFDRAPVGIRVHVYWG